MFLTVWTIYTTYQQSNETLVFLNPFSLVCHQASSIWFDKVSQGNLMFTYYNGGDCLHHPRRPPFCSATFELGSFRSSSYSKWLNFSTFLCQFSTKYPKILKTFKKTKFHQMYNAFEKFITQVRSTLGTISGARSAVWKSEDLHSSNTKK